MMRPLYCQSLGYCITFGLIWDCYVMAIEMPQVLQCDCHVVTMDYRRVVIRLPWDCLWHYFGIIMVFS